MIGCDISPVCDTEQMAKAGLPNIDSLKTLAPYGPWVIESLPPGESHVLQPSEHFHLFTD